MAVLMFFQILSAQNEKQISFLDFVELLSVHNDINIFIDENTTKEVSFFIPEDVKPKDYFDIFKISMQKEGFDVLKKGDVFYIDKIPDKQISSYLLPLRNNSFEDVSKYLKIKEIKHEYISSTNQILIFTTTNLISNNPKITS
jgi:hypothetical protein